MDLLVPCVECGIVRASLSSSHCLETDMTIAMHKLFTLQVLLDQKLETIFNAKRSSGHLFDGASEPAKEIPGLSSCLPSIGGGSGSGP